MDTIELPTELYTSFFKTGSSVICNPPVTNTDIDLMILVTDRDRVCQLLIGAGWDLGGHDYGENSKFISLKKGVYNYLLTSHYTYYTMFKEATTLATSLNLLQKEHRIILFDYVLRDL